MPPMIGDFDDSANTFWSLHMKEARSYDEARMQSLKDDMDSVIIFVRVHVSIVIFQVDVSSFVFRRVYSLLPSFHL